MLCEAEELLKQFLVLYPDETMLRLAIRGCATYQLNWFDAHLWAYAEHYGLRKSSPKTFNMTGSMVRSAWSTRSSIYRARWFQREAGLAKADLIAQSFAEGRYSPTAK